MAEPWVCPWGICNHEQAQACRANTRAGKYGLPTGCGGRFPPETTPDQAKRMIQPPARGVAAATPLSDEAIDKLARQHGATLEDDNGAVPAFYSIPMNRLAPFVRAACGVAVPRLPQQWEALIEEAVDAFSEGATLGDRLPNAMAALRDALASGVQEVGRG